MNILFIDTTKRDEILVELEVNGKKFVKKNSISQNQREVTLQLIDKILKENNVTPQDLSEIRVNEGPGSFTGIRVGISIANAMGFALKIPVNGKEAGEVQPKYEK